MLLIKTRNIIVYFTVRNSIICTFALVEHIDIFIQILSQISLQNQKAESHASVLGLLPRKAYDARYFVLRTVHRQ